MSDRYLHTFAPMGTVVTIEVVGHDESEARRTHRAEGVARAVAWFDEVERRCSRFDPASELRRLCGEHGRATPVSAMLFEAIRFALAVAEESEGAFDPTVGARMESLGFDRHHRTGARAPSGVANRGSVTWRDVTLDPRAQTVTLRKPLILDLGAVAKGLAVDVAARELASFENFAIDAGGDLYLGGRNAAGTVWSVGIRHPRDNTLVETLQLSNSAVCTSGDYARRSPTDGTAHHILDARTGRSAAALASVTVVAASAMVADALATAAFALGPEHGLQFLERHDVRGLLLGPSLERYETSVHT